MTESMAEQMAGQLDGDGRLLDPLVRRWTAFGVVASVAVFWMLGTLGRPARLFANPAALTANFYDIQAAALLRGHLSVPAGSLLAEEFHTPRGSMMYFGVFPAMIRIPVRLLVNGLDGRLTLLSCLVAVALLSVSWARIVRRAERRVLVPTDRTANHRWYAVVAMAPVLFSPVLFLASRSTVYHENLMWGVAGTTWGVDLAQQWWWSRRGRDAALAALAAAVAINSRPSVGLAPLLVIGTCAVLLAWRRELRAAMHGAVAVAVAAGTYMTVNFARFGQLWGAPHQLQESYRYSTIEQAAARATGNSLFSLRFLVNNAVRYLAPWPGSMRPSRLFPFVEFGSPTPSVLSAPMNVQYTGSLPAAAPVLMVLAVVGLVWIVRTPSPIWRVAAASTSLAALTTLGFWSSWHRYLVDFVPVLLVCAAPGWWCAHRWSTATGRTRRSATLALAALVAIVGLSGQAGLALWGRHFTYIPDTAEQSAFVRFRYDLDASLFGGRPPELEYIAAADPFEPLPDPQLGHVLVVGKCAGVYVANFGWQPMVLPSGGGHRAVIGPKPDRMTALTTAPSIVVRGRGWLLRSRPIPDPNLLGLYYVNRFGREVGVGVARIEDGPPVLDVVADPITGTFRVIQDGRTVIGLSHVMASGMIVGDDWGVFSVRDPWCDSLRERVDPAR